MPKVKVKLNTPRVTTVPDQRRFLSQPAGTVIEVSEKEARNLIKSLQACLVDEEPIVDPKGDSDLGQVDPKGDSDLGQVDPKGGSDLGQVDPKGGSDLEQVDPKGDSDLGQVDPKVDPIIVESDLGLLELSADIQNLLEVAIKDSTVPAFHSVSGLIIWVQEDGNRLSAKKGIGKKTEQKILDAIDAWVTAQTPPATEDAE